MRAAPAAKTHGQQKVASRGPPHNCTDPRQRMLWEPACRTRVDMTDLLVQPLQREHRQAALPCPAADVAQQFGFALQPLYGDREVPFVPDQEAVLAVNDHLGNSSARSG